MFSKISPDSSGNTCSKDSFLVKLQDVSNFIKKETLLKVHNNYTKKADVDVDKRLFLADMFWQRCLQTVFGRDNTKQAKVLIFIAFS